MAIFGSYRKDCRILIRRNLLLFVLIPFAFVVRKSAPPCGVLLFNRTPLEEISDSIGIRMMVYTIRRRELAQRLLGGKTCAAGPTTRAAGLSVAERLLPGCAPSAARGF